MRFPWTARRSSQLILKEINPEYSLEGLMVKLKLQHFGQGKQNCWGPWGCEESHMTWQQKNSNIYRFVYTQRKKYERNED